MISSKELLKLSFHKAMRRFFVEPSLISENSAVISGQEFRHIVKVLRLSEGDEIFLVDGNGFHYRTVIDSVGKHELTAKILEKKILKTEPDIDVTLFQGFLKGGKFDLVVQKAAELGAVKIVPVEFSRSDYKIEKIDNEKVKRWQRIAEYAACQSGRSRVPRAELPIKFREIPGLLKDFDLKLVFWEEAEKSSLKEIMRGSKNIRTIALILGPEGGLSGQEVMEAEKGGALVASLGPRILRAETAAISALTAVMYELGDMG